MKMSNASIIRIASKLLISEYDKLTAKQISDKINKAELTERGVTSREVGFNLKSMRDNGSYKLFEKIENTRPIKWKKAEYDKNRNWGSINDN